MVPQSGQQGDSGAQFQLAALYCTGTGVVRNLAEAVKWYRRSAEQGDRYAQYNLAVMLLKGQGTAPDAEEAFRWCCLAAEQGLGEAQLQLGDLYHAVHGEAADVAVIDALKMTSRALSNRASASSIDTQNPANSLYR